MLYFHYDPAADSVLKFDRRKERQARQHLIDALGLEGNQKEYDDRIFVAINSDMVPKVIDANSLPRYSDIIAEAVQLPMGVVPLLFWVERS